MKLTNILDIKNYLCKNRLFGKLVLSCEDEILNTTETSLNDKKVNVWKKLLPYSHIFDDMINIKSLDPNKKKIDEAS